MNREIIQRFDPVQYSVAENEFLRDQIGQPPVVALKALPTNVNPRSVTPILNRVYELVELEKHSGQEWVGVEAIQEAITTYLEKAERWAQDRRRGAPRFPSQHVYDSKGRPHFQGVGSDAGLIKTYFTPKGDRKRFEIELIPTGAIDWSPDWVKADAPKEAFGLKLDNEKNRYECLICGHTESFNSASRSSQGAAKGRMSRHFRKATEKVDEHREAHAENFS